MSFPLEDDPLLTGIVDDSGLGTNGTVLDAPWMREFATLITSQVYDPLNPTVSPVGVIQEVIAGRGGQASLDARLDAIDTIIAGLGSPNDARTLNLLVNDDWAIWAEEGAAASLPAGWSRSGAGSGAGKCAVSRGTVNVGSQYSLAATSGNATGGVAQFLIPKGTVSPYLGYLTNFFGRKFSAIAKVNVVTGNARVRIKLFDGTNTFISAFNATTGAVETLSVSGTLAANAEQLLFTVEGLAGTTWSTGPVAVVLTNLPLTDWIPSETVLQEKLLDLDGTTLNAECRVLMPRRPSLLRQVAVYGKTVPAGLRVTIEKWHWDTNTGFDTDHWQAIYSAALRPTAGTTVGGESVLDSVDGATPLAEPDGTYTERCFGGSHAYDMVRARVSTQDAAAVAIKVAFRYTTAQRQLERFLSPL